MRRTTALAILAVLGLPATAQAADYVALTVGPTQVAPGWTLSATVTNGRFYRGDEIVGLTLRRSFLRGDGEELHALKAHPDRTTISFDGRRGRWATRGLLGAAATVDLAIETTGPPTAVSDAWACRGALVRVPVTLRGTLSLRTGTRFFRTIRRTRLAGFVTIDDGAVSCDPSPPAACEPSTTFHAGGPGGSLLASERRLGLQFREPVAGSVAWYHVLAVSGPERRPPSKSRGLPCPHSAAAPASLARPQRRRAPARAGQPRQAVRRRAASARPSSAGEPGRSGSDPASPRPSTRRASVRETDAPLRCPRFRRSRVSRRR